MHPSNSLFHASPLLFKRSDREVPNALAWVDFDYYEHLHSNLSTYFTLSEITSYRSFPSLKRKKTYLLGRYAAKLAAGYYLNETQLKKIEVASTVVQYPVIKHLSMDTPEITLSHCEPLALALANEAGHVVGLDIEKKNPTKVRVFERSMTASEIDLCHRLKKVPFTTLANVLWTVHESLSKAIKCGFAVPFKLLEIENLTLQDTQDTHYHCTFKHFTHLHSYAYIFKRHILAISLPIKTQLILKKQSIGLI